MTQYYEPEARELELRACASNDHAEQGRLWAEAARIGTRVEWCPSGLHELWPQGATIGEDCEDICEEMAAADAAVGEEAGMKINPETDVVTAAVAGELPTGSVVVGAVGDLDVQLLAASEE